MTSDISQPKGKEQILDYGAFFDNWLYLHYTCTSFLKCEFFFLAQFFFFSNCFYLCETRFFFFFETLRKQNYALFILQIKNWMKSTRRTFKLTYKLTIIKKARRRGNIRATARKYNVRPRQIRCWRRKRNRMLETIKRNPEAKKINRRRHPSLKKKLIATKRNQMIAKDAEKEIEIK